MDLINFVVDFVPETIALLLWLLFLASAGLIYYWLKNKNDYINFSHDIPESVVRDYQDTISSNQDAIKSNVVGESKFASIMRAQDLKNNTANVLVSNELIEKLTAEVMDLKSNLNSRDRIIDDLEKRIPSSGAESETFSKVQGQEEDEELQSRIRSLKEENKELRGRLKEFELIEDDISELRELKIENKRLKALLNIDEENDDINRVGSIDETDDEVHVVAVGENIEHEGITIMGDDEFESSGVQFSKEDLSPKKNPVTLKDDKKNFGTVKIKDGSIFGKKGDKKKVSIESSEAGIDSELNEEISAIREETSNNELSPKPKTIEEVSDIGTGAKLDSESLDLRSIESRLDENEEQSLGSVTIKESENESKGAGKLKVVDKKEEVTESNDESNEEFTPEVKEKVQVEGSSKIEKSDQSEAEKSAEELLDEFEKMLG